MTTYSHKEALAFQRALTKLGWVPAFKDVTKRMIQTSGSMGGVGAAGGAIVGGGIQGVRGYSQARREGATGGQALSQGLMKGVGGAAAGAAIGAGTGVVGGAALGRFRPDVAQKSVGWLNKHVGGPSRYGQRQAHWLTGWQPKGGLEELQMGTSLAKKNLEGAQKQLTALRDTPKGKFTPQWAHDLKLRGAERKVERIRDKHIPAMERAESMGLTSLPGYARSLARNGVLPTLGAAAKESWHSSGPVGKALMFGLPAASAASGVKGMVTGEEGSGQKLTGALSLATFPLFSPMTMTGQMLLSHPLSVIGDKAGGAAENALRRRRGLPPIDPGQYAA